jgi:hypothetical protein
MARALSRATLAALLAGTAAAAVEAVGAVVIGGVTVAGEAYTLVQAPPGTPSLAAWLAARAAAGAAPLAAWGTFADTIATTGWSTLEVFSNASFDDVAAVRAAGFWEGAVTQRRTWEFASNVHGGTSRWSPQLRDFVYANLEWMRATAQQRCAGEPFWQSVRTQLEQWEGLYAGYNATAPAGQALDRDTLYASTLIGDMDDLCVVFGCTDRHAPPGTPPVKAPYLGVGGHCSVLIKPLGPPGAPTDFIMGHTTWSPYETMTRVWKRYTLPLHATCAAGSDERVPVQTLSFPSYPGALFSNDDLYVTSGGLVITGAWRGRLLVVDGGPGTARPATYVGRHRPVWLTPAAHTSPHAPSIPPAVHCRDNHPQQQLDAVGGGDAADGARLGAQHGGQPAGHRRPDVGADLQPIQFWDVLQRVDGVGHQAVCARAAAGGHHAGRAGAGESARTGGRDARNALKGVSAYYTVVDA